MALENESSLDGIDSRILKILEMDGRISLSKLAANIEMSAPSVSERVRRLESRGIIKHFTVDLDLPSLGYALQAVVRIKPRPGQLKGVEKMIEEQQRFIACDKVTGDDCFIARLALKSIDELDYLLEPLHDYAETNTAIVKSSLIEQRIPFNG